MAGIRCLLLGERERRGATVVTIVNAGIVICDDDRFRPESRGRLIPSHQTPGDLAGLLQAELAARDVTSPPRPMLDELFETMFSVSLRTEEGAPVTFQVCFIDPVNPDPHPPPNIRRHRWRSFPLAEHVPFEDAPLTKLAKASDPRTSALAVYVFDGQLKVWGLIDQGSLYFDWVNRDAERVHGFRPGVFQASVEGPAHIMVWIDLERVAELGGSRLAGRELDAISAGPFRDALTPTLTAFRKDVLGELPDGAAEDQDLAEQLEDRLAGALSGVLLRSQRLGHGGAFLITPDTATGLNIKYALNYPRLRESLVFSAVHGALVEQCWHEIHDEYLEDEDQDSLPIMLHLDSSIEENKVDDARLELSSITRFISLLTRVDGLVLLTPSLDVVGFGVEITIRDDPAKVVLARDASARELEPVDPTSFGTRHRSMMRYCAANPGSVGFVISQDGDVRAMTRGGDQLVVWNQIKLQTYQNSRPRPSGTDEHSPPAESSGAPI